MSDNITIPDENIGGERPVIVTELFSGPVPHPSVLERYKAVGPEFPMMLMNMAIDEQKNRHESERYKIDVVKIKFDHEATEQKDRALFGRRGQVCGVVIWISLILLVALAACLGLATAVEYGIIALGGFAAFSALMREFMHYKKDRKDS